MSMSQLQQTMATLRMTLAEIQNKEQQLDALISQFRTQLQRLPRQVIYGSTPLDIFPVLHGGNRRAVGGHGGHQEPACWPSRRRRWRSWPPWSR